MRSLRSFIKDNLSGQFPILSCENLWGLPLLKSYCQRTDLSLNVSGIASLSSFTNTGCFFFFKLARGPCYFLSFFFFNSLRVSLIIFLLGKSAWYSSLVVFNCSSFPHKQFSCYFLLPNFLLFHLKIVSRKRIPINSVIFHINQSHPQYFLLEIFSIWCVCWKSKDEVGAKSWGFPS